MKKILTSAIVALALLGNTAYGQKIAPNRVMIPTGESYKQKANPFTLNKAAVTGWYNTLDYILAGPLGTGLQGFADFIYNDSNAKSVLVGTSGENTIRGFGKIAVGQVLDPKDNLIDLTQTPGLKLSTFTNYQVDSIRFTYRYVRNVDSIDDGLGGKMPVVDTLFVAYFKGNQITKRGLTFNGPPQYTQRYGTFGWTGGNVRLPNAYHKMDTILLTRNDSTTVLNNNGFENSWRSKIMSLKAPDGLSINANGGQNTDNLVGYAFTFKSGVNTISTTGDTAIMIYQKDPATLPAGAHRVNYFGYGLFSYQGTANYENTTFYNSSLSVESFSGYTPWVVNSSVTFNGWIPGGIWNDPQFIDADFLLTSLNSSVEETNGAEFVSSLYPNPAEVNGTAKLSLTLANKGAVSVSVLNLNGQVVKNVYNDNLNTGNYLLSFDLSGIAPGIYMVNTTVNGTTETTKLVISK